MAAKRDSAFDQAALDDLEALFAHLADSIESLMQLGLNAAAWISPATADSFATWSKSPKRNANSGWTTPSTPQTGEFTDEELVTITAEDVRNSVEPLLQGLGLQEPA